MEEGIVSTIFYQSLVILSEAKDRFKLSGITHNTRIHPERTGILNLVQDLSAPGPWTSHYHTVIS